MRSFILLFLFLSGSLYANECQLIDNQGINPPLVVGKKLSVFWSQEYTGTDLVKIDLEDISWASRVSVSVFDSGFEKDFINSTLETKIDSTYVVRNRRLTGHHGTSVANIINGNGSYGVSTKVDYLGLINVKFSSAYNSEFKRYDKQGIYPKIISNSYGWRNSEEIQSLSIKAKERNILWFLAAGNDYPDDVSVVENNSGAILIGSHAPSGLQSSFSQVSDNVITLAPGDDYQAAIDGKGEHSLFGGTSGATPLVAGSVANIASLLPDITYDQIIKLIKRTNLISFEQNNNSRYTPGIFNAYKAFSVGKRIAVKCNYHQNSLDTKCIERELENEENLDFSDQIVHSPVAEVILDDSSNCLQRKDKFKQLRKDALLIDSPILWGRLERVYKVLGYTKNAEFYSNLKTRFELTDLKIKEMEIGAINSLKDGKFFESYFRYQSYYSEEYQMSLAQLLIKDPSIDKYWTTSFLSQIKDLLNTDVIEYLSRERELSEDQELVKYISKIIE